MAPRRRPRANPAFPIKAYQSLQLTTTIHPTNAPATRQNPPFTSTLDQIEPWSEGDQETARPLAGRDAPERMGLFTNLSFKMVISLAGKGSIVFSPPFFHPLILLIQTAFLLPFYFYSR